MNMVDVKNAVETAEAVKAGRLPGPAKTLAEAMSRIYADGGRYVQKAGQMQGVARYSYAKEGDFIAAVRPLMEAHGVTIRPVGYQVLTNEEFTRKSGGNAYRVVVLATFEFLHASGDRATAQAIGEGQDSGDKAFNKAMTGAMKYVLRQSFCVETGDDPDDTPSHEHERAERHAPPPAKGVPAADFAKLMSRFATVQKGEWWHKLVEDVKAVWPQMTGDQQDRINAATEDAKMRLKSARPAGAKP